MENECRTYKWVVDNELVYDMLVSSLVARNQNGGHRIVKHKVFNFK